jgi:hypothetical protein
MTNRASQKEERQYVPRVERRPPGLHFTKRERERERERERKERRTWLGLWAESSMPFFSIGMYSITVLVSIPQEAEFRV